MTDKLLLTIDAAADRLSVSRDTVARLIKQGVLPPFHIGKSVRIRAADLDAYVELHGPPPLSAPLRSTNASTSAGGSSASVGGNQRIRPVRAIR